MNKQKEIEKMEFIISSTIHECEQKDCIRNCEFARSKDCKFFRAAKDLANAGYGNTKVVIKEFAEKLKKKIAYCVEGYGTAYDTTHIRHDIVRALIDKILKELCENENI